MRLRRAKAPTVLPRRRGWPGSVRVIRQTVNVPDPTVVAIVGAFDASVGHGMDGHTGTIIAGEPSSATYKFAGYLTPATTPMGSYGRVTSLLHRPSTALPATSGPVVAGRTVADVIAGVLPAGSGDS